MESQNSYIRERKIDYVVIREKIDENGDYIRIPNLLRNYRMIESDQQWLEDILFVYHLFEIRDNPLEIKIIR